MFFDLPPQPLWLPPKPAIIRPSDFVRDAKRVDRKERLAGLVSVMPIYKPVAAGYPTRTNTDNKSSSSTTTNFSFASTAAGSPSGTSIVVVVASVFNLGTNGSAINSITIDGSAGTIVENASQLNVGSTWSACAIAYRATSNTSMTIAVATAQNGFRCFISVYRLNDLNAAAPVDHDKATGVTPSSLSFSTIDVTGQGIVIAGTAAYVVNAANATISGVGTDRTVTDTTVYHSVAGSSDNVNTASNSTVSATYPAASAGAALAAVSWH